MSSEASAAGQRHFLYEMTRSSFLLKRESSLLGILWYIVGPLMVFIVLYIIFAQRLGATIPHYPLYLLLGVVLWNFFTTATSESLRCLFAAGSLIKALPVRRDGIVLSTVLATLMSHAVEIFIFLLFSIFSETFSFTWFLWPIVLIAYVSITLGIGLALSVIYPLFLDIDQIWSLWIRLWWFATPIFYSLTSTGPGSKLNMINPMYYVITMSRDLLIYNHVPDVLHWVFLLGFASVSLLCGKFIFQLFVHRVPESV